MRRHWEAVAALAVCCVALILGRPPLDAGAVFPDSHAYILWPADFFLDGGLRVMGSRPPGYALLLDVFGAGAALVWAQSALSFAAWSFLGWLVGRLGGVIVACAFALAPAVWRWNACVLTESSSLSTLALALGLALVLARRAARGEAPGAKLLAAWAACTLFFCWSRDANLVLVPVLVVPALWLRGRARLVVLGIALLGGVVGAYDSARNGRSVYSLDNAILERVLPDREAVARFSAAGMPVSDELLSGAGSPGSRTQRRLRASVPEFFRWTEDGGASVYWRWVLGRPASYAEAWRAAHDFAAEDFPHYPNDLALPGAVRAANELVAYGPRLWACVLLALLAGLAGWRERRCRPELALALAGCAVALAYCFLTYHADAAEVHRHMLLGLVLAFVCAFLALRALVSSVRALFARRAAPAAHES